MSWRSFLLDRMAYVTVYIANIVLVMIVMELALLPQGMSLQKGNMLYIAVLALAGVMIFLLIDYARQRAYFGTLKAIRGQSEPLDRLAGLPDGVTREQTMTMELLRQLYVGCEEKIAHYRRQQEHHNVFVRQWVHQMKTPVSVIDLLTQQSGTGESGTAEPVLRSIQEENDRLAHGLDMMLQTARLEKFAVDVHIHRVDLERVVREVINEHKRACIRHGVFPKLVVEEEARYVESDDKWLSVAVRQIVSNALKYSGAAGDRAGDGPAGKRLDITVAREDGDVCVRFSDNGIGIAEQDLPRVFDPFFTGENGRKVGESTGMGLYLVKELCDRLGHRVQIASKVGRGTTVTLRFPPASVLHDVLKRPM
ncbi:sensor histidine kinase [Paenibacillus doosanensis]|uniref:sensor histidine kinase n=1 Tax=Paenibacillus doosanensis TaxID=1229154 RepID=UPI00218034E8|nr:sensor histidine kinase [Paenibacillus doosanensis]MCS7459876.1 sensor histidine kinase [Paenibacillus doosanensis]